MKEIDLRERILYALYRRQYWGGRHTSVENAMKGIPSNLLGEAKKSLDQLIKDRYLIPKPTGYGFHISLNPTMKSEIERAIEKRINFINKYNIILK